MKDTITAKTGSTQANFITQQEKKTDRKTQHITNCVEEDKNKTQ